MPEPFKNLFNRDLILTMSGLFDRLEGFDKGAFERIALAGLDDLEMMERSAQITGAMKAAIPGSMPDLLRPLSELLHPDLTDDISGGPSDARGLRGWACVPVGNYVADTCLQYPEFALQFLAELTKRFSAEFAVRPFFRDHPDITIGKALEWTKDPNHHVRRLASEGSRPRFPWGIRLQDFVKDPAPILPILAALKDDPSEYVRRSVANNLNDIAKDHPDIVNQIAAEWMQDAPPNRRRLVKHACRSLIKSGNPDTLAIFGYGDVSAVRADLAITPTSIRLGDQLQIDLELAVNGSQDLTVLIDLVLGFRKANGTLSSKVFKWTETTLNTNTALRLRKSLPIKPVTTRRHYTGKQSLSVQVNGVILATSDFELIVPD